MDVMEVKEVRGWDVISERSEGTPAAPLTLTRSGPGASEDVKGRVSGLAREVRHAHARTHRRRLGARDRRSGPAAPRGHTPRRPRSSGGARRGASGPTRGPGNGRDPGRWREVARPGLAPAPPTAGTARPRACMGTTPTDADGVSARHAGGDGAWVDGSPGRSPRARATGDADVLPDGLAPRRVHGAGSAPSAGAARVLSDVT